MVVAPHGADSDPAHALHHMFQNGKLLPIHPVDAANGAAVCVAQLLCELDVSEVPALILFAAALHNAIAVNSRFNLVWNKPSEIVDCAVATIVRRTHGGLLVPLCVCPLPHHTGAPMYIVHDESGRSLPQAILAADAGPLVHKKGLYKTDAQQDVA
jgi:hypothetical protein